MKPMLKFWRRLVQITVALTFIFIPYLNRQGINSVRGNFFAFSAAGLPLADPLSVAQVGIKSWHFSSDLLLGAGIALILAMSLGTVFCSWICPYGLLSEWVHNLGGKILPRNQGVACRGNGFYYKLILFGLSLLILFSTDSPFLNQLSMPGWYSRLFQIYFNQGVVSWAAGGMVAILLFEFIMQNRIWCRYICPQALFLTSARLINPWYLKITYDQEKCRCKKGEDPCRRICHLGLNPKTLPHPHDLECTNCGDCVITCKKLGQALGFHFRGKSK
jgi:ferredoxin-type protein NapH